jgi:hypothetical protein
MNIRRIIKEYAEEKQLREGFDEAGEPDLKYYAFDWDDNIVTMPTQIVLQDENGGEVGMSTEDFAEYREQIGKEPFDYKNKKIVGYADDPYRNFGVKGDKAFIVDSMMAKTGPSWNDFVEAINGAVYNMIVTDHNGISKEDLLSNLKRYREYFDETKMSDKEMIDFYLDLAKFHPVTYGEGSAANPEEGKIVALRNFLSYVKNMAQELGEKAYFKNDVKNNFVPNIGFSDDDARNIEKIKDFLDAEDKDKLVKTYLTKGGEKQEV